MERAYSILFLIYIFSAMLTALLAVYSFRFRKLKVSLSFAVLMALVSIWALTVAFGLVSANENISFIFIIIRMVAVILVPIAWLIFVLNFTDRTDWLIKKTTVLVFSISLLSVALVVTTRLHGLFINHIDFQRFGPFLVEVKWHLGPYYWFHVVYSYVLIFIGMVLILQKAVGLKDRYRLQALALLIGTIVPLIGNIILVFDLLPGTKVNYDVLGFVISGIAFLWAIYYQDLFELKPIARKILFEHMSEGMLVINNEMRIVDFNPAVIKILGLNDQNIFGENAVDLFTHQRDIQSLINEKVSINVEWVKESEGEDDEFYTLAISPINHKGQELGFLFTFNDVTEQTRLSNQMQELAITDALTGLYNHRHFYELMGIEISRSQRTDQPLSIIIFDIDDFKKVNDTYGHIYGDQVLNEAARICKTEIRPYDVIARYGGEEFVIILPETGSEEAFEMAERIRKLVADHVFEVPSGAINITISLGISTLVSGDDQTIEELINQADMGLYQAKEQGKNKTTANPTK